VSQLMVKLVGTGFASGGTMSMAFIKPVYAGDRLTVHGVIKDKQSDNGVTRVVVEVWVENQHGEKTAVGHATGLVS
jgi:acyl dehydratase